MVLRQKTKKNRPLEVIGYISKKIRGPKSIQEGEYLALIEGLKLASRYAPTDLRVVADSAFVVKQVNETEPRIKQYMKHLHTDARDLIDKIGEQHIKISWVPREMNEEANQRAADAFFKRDGNTWTLRPTAG